ncbi:hypothetical protein QN362_00035 [Actimicrobium sp. CCC2.4]|uniref:hypothetical protein n=1 Tax=Actimicrobium sp. CCC2.4 TaxID=3048606 RepID=UPI002AC8BD53|nr:hypothetical protein [Actimicrobium sp. CCC2.4]MEB0133713.1 hypothetical protein [Actimicrobium sp. CCC2.4]WPX31260.1 hypothetical protein RHM62_13520 [Actimicrobium sp. CCC2.4]
MAPVRSDREIAATRTSFILSLSKAQRLVRLRQAQDEPVAAVLAIAININVNVTL